MGATVGFQGAQFGFELGLEVLAGADSGELGLVFFGEGELAVKVSAERGKAGALVGAFLEVGQFGTVAESA